MDTRLIERMLDVIETDIVPLTRRGVAEGNKLFGAAILGADGALVVAETNNETENPLWHGEMHAIRRFFQIDANERPEPADCLFLATHEPCSLCLSGITWSGFRNFHYLFRYEDSRDAFAIPYDIEILRAVYAVPDPDREAVPTDRPLYNRRNKYWTSHALLDAIAAQPDEATRTRLMTRVERIRETYAALSATYQADKGAKGIPHA